MITDKQSLRDRINARFRSGNSVPVERAHITASEWTELRAALEAAEAAREPTDYPNPGAHTPLRPAVPEQPPAAQGEAPCSLCGGDGGHEVGLCGEGSPVYAPCVCNPAHPKNTTPQPSADDAPPFDFAAHLARQAAWSAQTFGPGSRLAGVTDHIRKELVEVQESGGSLAEWIDVVILALDGCWRSGATPQQIIDAIVAKQTRNEGRAWPDWRTMPADKAIEHDRSKDDPADARDAGRTMMPIPNDPETVNQVAAIMLLRDAEDARRYRWLRAADCPSAQVIIDLAHDHSILADSEALDQHIDRAMGGE